MNQVECDAGIQDILCINIAEIVRRVYHQIDAGGTVPAEMPQRTCGIVGVNKTSHSKAIGIALILLEDPQHIRLLHRPQLAGTVEFDSLRLQKLLSVPGFSVIRKRRTEFDVVID